MSEDNRALLVAAIFGLIATSAGLGSWLTTWASLPGQEQEEPSASRQRYEAAAAKGDYAPYPIKKAAACYQAENHDTADLCAQWRAAIAAEDAADSARWANWLSLMGAALTFIATTFVYFTLRETRRTANAALAGVSHAARATDAAVRSADATEKAVLGLERPLLLPQVSGSVDPDFTNRLANERGMVRLLWGVRLFNVGRSPAFIRSFSAEPFCLRELPDPETFWTSQGRARIVESTTEEGLGVRRTPESRTPAIRLIKPDNDVEIVSDSLWGFRPPRNAAGDIWNGQLFLCVIGWIAYSDMLGRRFSRHFLYRWRYVGEGTAGRTVDFEEHGGEAYNYDRPDDAA